MAQERTIEDVKNYMQNNYSNYNISTLENMLKSLETIQSERAQDLTEEGEDSDNFLDDDVYYILAVCIDIVNKEITKERVLKSALTGPRKTARITSSIRLTGQRSEGGRKRTRRHRKSRKSRKSKRHRKTRRH